MDIQIGKIYKNKTFNFLIPILSEYPTSFRQKMSQQVSKLAYGIFDNLILNTDILKESDRPIFILCDKLSGNFDSFIEWLRTQDYYITDYVAGVDVNSRFHMIVINTIEEYTTTYDKFIVGLYSEMYSEEQINKLFDTNRKDVVDILTKDTLAKNKFIKKINDTFEVTIEDSNYFDEALKEYEFPYKVTESEEIFNYKIKH